MLAADVLTPDDPLEELPGVVGAVLCAIEPTLPSLEAARQAALLARGGRLELLPVGHRRAAGIGAAYVAAARYVAARHGTVPVAAGPERGVGSRALVAGAGPDDLVVVAADGPRLSAVARAALTDAAAPVLVARPANRGARLGDRPLAVAADDRRTAAEIVRATRAGAVTLVVFARAGLRALVVAEYAPCSVLVLRPSADRAP